jgi:hypothetical protein
VYRKKKYFERCILVGKSESNISSWAEWITCRYDKNNICSDFSNFSIVYLQQQHQELRLLQNYKRRQIDRKREEESF